MFPASRPNYRDQMRDSAESDRIAVRWFACGLWTSAGFAQSQTTAAHRHGQGSTRRSIAGAQVTIRNNTTAEEREVKTDEQGNYSVPLLFSRKLSGSD